MPASGDWFNEFEFDLSGALLRDLVNLLNGMTREPLKVATVVGRIPEEQGVYQLFLDDKLAYVGKTDAEAGLKQRLIRHAEKIQQREKLDPQRVSFKAVRIFVFTPFDLETQLIKYYSKAAGIEPTWNLSGFGSNDPGRARDTTRLKPGHFDLTFPIDIDVPLNTAATTGTFQVADVLAKLKTEVTYVIRFQKKDGKSRIAHADLTLTTVKIPAGIHTTRTILKHVQKALGPKWQITVQPGYVIVYKERVAYRDARKL